MEQDFNTSGSDDGDIVVQDVLIDLDAGFKGRLVSDLSSICSVSQFKAKEMLERYNWNIQLAIDTFLNSNQDSENGQESDDDVVMLPTPPRVNRRLVDETILLGDSPDPDKTLSPGLGGRVLEDGVSFSFSRVAPEKVSILSWNLDGLDGHNLEKRTDAVIQLIEKEDHGIVFLQELIPLTFDYIARKLSSKYFPVIGTLNPNAQYFTATFLRVNRVFHEDDYIVPYDTVMDRNLLVTKAFIGRVKLFLLNTHLESTAEFKAKRVAQLKLCFQHCLNIPPEYNVIFGGDLNLRDKEVDGILPPTISDLWIECGSRESARYTWDLTRNLNKQMPFKNQPRCRFDRLYFRPSTPKTLTPEFFAVTGIEKVDGTASHPSDHWGILSFLRLSEAARQPMSDETQVNDNDSQ